MSYDSDAQAYIAAVETADGQTLPYTIKDAINNFVVGCKSDSIWTAIKAACFLAGPATLAGALTPLVGTAPTNVNFVSADHSQMLGLTGNGSTKYLNSNRNSNADGQDDNSVCVHITNSAVSGGILAAVTNQADGVGGTQIAQNTAASNFPFRSRLSEFVVAAQGTRSPTGQPGFYGISRSAAASFVARFGGISETITSTSATPLAIPSFIFARNRTDSVIDNYFSGRVAFYSIGASLSLSALDARVTTYMAEITRPIVSRRRRQQGAYGL